MVNREQLVTVSFSIRTRGHEVKTAGAKSKADKLLHIINKLWNFLHKTLWV